MEQIGRFNVDRAGDAYDKGVRFKMVIISEFDKNDKEIVRKTFYCLGDTSPLQTEAQVAQLMHHPNNSKVILDLALRVTAV